MGIVDTERALTTVSDYLCFRPEMEGKPMAQNSITVRQSYGGWEVIIIESGQENLREFQNGSFANSYADGQSVRLGVQVRHLGSEPLQGSE